MSNKLKAQTYVTVAILIVMLLGPGVFHSAVLGGPARLTVRGTDSDLGECPLVAETSASLPAGTYRLQGDAGGAAIPAQVFEERGKRYFAVVLPSVPRASETRYSLELGSPSGLPLSQGVFINRIGGNLRVALDGRLWTEYRVDVGHKPFFYPLIGPTGEPFTRAYPMRSVEGEDRDHPHQRSCWLTHGKVNGVDFWSESTAAGTIKELERAVIVEGPVLARLWTKNGWVGPDGKKVCTDERSVTFYRTTHARMIDFDFTIRADSGPVTFGETKEGMFGLRVASSMDVSRKQGGKITSALGLTDESAWGEPSPWVDYAGPVGGKMVGIAVLNHPDSFRYPTTWHVRPYGLFAANPFGGHDFHKPQLGEHTIVPGEVIRFGYRVILHEGPTAAAGLPAQFLAYAKPPRLEVKTEK